MGEYAQYQGEQIKIGTCESLYYLRADQADLVSPPVTDEGYRFRFPFPDEDGIEPGQFEDYGRGRRVYGLTVPDDLAENHYSVQFRADNGYLCSLPCPESGKVPDGVRIAKNGYGGAASIVQQRRIGETLHTVCQCNGCGMAWRLETLEDAQPLLDSLEREAVEQDQTAERSGTPGNADVAVSIRELARRVRDGYPASRVPA